MAGHRAPACRSDGRSLHHRPLTATEDWLRPRLAGAPQSLREIVGRQVAASEADRDVPDALGDAAVNALRVLLEQGEHSRVIANDLLAIDALVTYACEAAVERWRDEPRADRADLERWCGELAARLAAAGGE